MPKLLEHHDIGSLTLGSILLGSGGGGNAFILSPVVENYLLKQGVKVKLIPYHELPDDTFVAAIGMLGSPELMEENLPDGTEGVRAITLLEQALHRKIDVLYSLEGAGVNMLYPLLVAAKTGLPLIDGDGMGRAFPELQMTTFHIYGQPGTPFALTNSEGKQDVFYNQDNFLLDLATRKALVQYGGVGYFAGFAMSGRKVKDGLVPGTLSFALELGKSLHANHYEEALLSLIQCTKNSLYGRAIELFIGTVEEVGEIAALKLKSISLKGLKQYREDSCNILMQNENVFAYRNNKVVAMVPDIISFLSYPAGQPVNNNEIYSGMQIAVIGIPCPALLRTRRALAVVGPSSFGYKMEYEPLEQLHQSYYFGG